MSQTPVDRELEAIVSLTQGDPIKSYQIVEHQLSVLVVRTQVLLSLSGIVITVTGFSGRAIAQTSPLARILISSGIGIVLLSAAVAITGVLRLKWLTEMGGDWRTMLRRGLETREAKTRWLSAALTLFVVGFGCYVGAIIQLLLAAKPE